MNLKNLVPRGPASFTPRKNVARKPNVATEKRKNKKKSNSKNESNIKSNFKKNCNKELRSLEISSCSALQDFRARSGTGNGPNKALKMETEDYFDCTLTTDWLQYLIDLDSLPGTTSPGARNYMQKVEIYAMPKAVTSITADYTGNLMCLSGICMDQPGALDNTTTLERTLFSPRSVMLKISNVPSWVLLNSINLKALQDKGLGLTWGGHQFRLASLFSLSIVDPDDGKASAVPVQIRVRLTYSSPLQVTSNIAVKIHPSASSTSNVGTEPISAITVSYPRLIGISNMV